MRQINKIKLNCVCMWNPHKHERFPRHSDKMRYICHRAMEKMGISDFKRKESNPQEDERNKCLVNKCLQGHTETMG